MQLSSSLSWSSFSEVIGASKIPVRLVADCDVLEVLLGTPAEDWRYSF